jgi:hypothetical protein
MQGGEENPIQGQYPTTLEQGECASYHASIIVVLPVRREREYDGR